MSDFQQFDDSQALEAFNLVNAIAKHNSDFSSMRLLMRGMATSMMQGKEPDSSTIDETSSSMNALDKLAGDHRSILFSLGLELTPITGTISSGSQGNERAVTNTVRISFFDTERFVSFLDTLPDDATNRDDLNELVNELAKCVASHLSSKEFVFGESETSTAIASDLKEALNHFRRLNVEGRTVSEIDFYLDKFDKEILLQAILIRQAGLLLEPGEGFGPASWPMDMTEEFFEVTWREALDKVSELSNNGNEITFRSEVAEHLLRCCSIAVQWIDSNTTESDEDYLGPSKSAHFKEVIGEAVEELNKYV